MSYHPEIGHSASPLRAAVGPDGIKVDQLKSIYSRNEARLSKTKDQLNEIITQQRGEGRGQGQSTSELDDKDKKMYQLYQQLEVARIQLEQQQKLLHERLKKIEDQEDIIKLKDERLRQQQATIRVQSDTIQNPNPKNPFTTPHPRGENLTDASSKSNVYQLPPPVDFSHNSGRLHNSKPPRSIYALGSQANLLANTTPSYQQSISIATNDLQNITLNAPSTGLQPICYGSPSPVSPIRANDLGSPEILRTIPPVPLRLSRTTQESAGSIVYPKPAASLTPEQFQRIHVSPVQTTTDSVLVKGSLAPPGPAQANVPFGEISKSPLAGSTAGKLNHIIEMAEKYAFSHVNFPSTAGDAALPKSIKERLMKAVSTRTAAVTMSSTHTRYLVVSKVIFEWLMKHVLQPTLYNEFDRSLATNIDQARAQLYQTTPAAVRYLLHNTIAKELRKAEESLNFSDFRRNVCKHRANELWKVVHPLMHKKTTKDWDDLLYLVRESHDLAEMMFTGNDAAEYSFMFPKVGDAFQSTTMKNRDPFVKNVTDQELDRRGAVVRLGFSPRVTTRTCNMIGQQSLTELRVAEVLVKVQS